MTFEDWMRSERVTYKPSDDSVEDRMLRRAWDAAVAAERERCARLCEQEHQESGEHPEMALHCAERIRGLRA